MGLVGEAPVNLARNKIDGCVQFLGFGCGTSQSFRNGLASALHFVLRQVARTLGYLLIYAKVMAQK